MKLSLKITEANDSQQCDAASLFDGFWKVKTLVDMHHYVWVKTRNRWRNVDSPVGPIRSLLPPVTVSGRDAAMDAIPGFGQHNDAIRAEFSPRAINSTKKGISHDIEHDKHSGE
ncbi:hypothetical protein [Ferrimicrobium acidiphilum]|nr:hypothetical protein [Ferrimicrobium acidiphilum]